MIEISTLLKGIARPFEILAAYRQSPATGKLLSTFLGIRSHFPMDIALRGGGCVRVFSRGEAKVFWVIFAQECYRLWPDCQTIIDAGANIGTFSVWAARRLPQVRILALEPCPDTFSKLQHNLEVNQLGSRVQPVQLALAAQCGEREIGTAVESQRRSLVPADLHAVKGKSIKVPSITLAELMERYQLHQIDLLKMDIEGSEWEVLLSTPIQVLRRIRRIQFEYHEVHARFRYSKSVLFEHLASADLNLTYCREDKHGTGLAVVVQEAQNQPGI